MNSTWNVSDRNRTYHDETSDVSITAVVSGLIVVVWTSLANSVIVLCFIINRKKTWSSFSTQVLCLSITDMFVGLASLSLAILPLLNKTLNYRTCLVFFFLFFSSQCASLYQIFGICVHRCILINKASRINEQRSDNRFPFALILSSWILSIVVNFLLHFLYGCPEVAETRCNFNELFEGNTKNAALFLFNVYFVPYIFTNVLYVVICLRIRCIWKKVVPAQVNEMEADIYRIPRSVPPTLTQQNNTAGITDNRASIRAQQTVIKTVGALMLIFNICTIPLIVMFRMEINHHGSRDLKFIVSTMFILNSSINPFVYAVRTHWLRAALKQMFKSCFKTIIPCER